MCGITGGIGERNMVPVLLEGLKRLEYRGYDSAGIACWHKGKITRVRHCGKVRDLVDKPAIHELSGTMGIAHTRWATHGRPSEKNAHPHMSGESLAIVHNGIIENYTESKKQLGSRGFVFQSDTDTEVIAHSIQEFYQQHPDFAQAVKKAVATLEGSYALAIMSAEQPNYLMAVRKGCPMVIGLGIGENFVASDVLALLPVTQSFIVLEDGDVAAVYRDKVVIWDKTGQLVTRDLRHIQLSSQTAEKGSYRHFMQKEIFEQAMAISESLEGRLLGQTVPDHIFGDKASNVFDETQAVQIVACGTSYHAGLLGKYWIESLAGIPTQVEVASEFRSRKSALPQNTLFVVISQSGETLDTLASLQAVDKSRLSGVLGICNVPESAIVRSSECVFLTHAGPEIGVASTKAFTTQLVALLLLSVVLGRRHSLSKKDEHSIVQALRSLPESIEKLFLLDDTIKALVSQFKSSHSALFLGRGSLVPIAMEGALKLKEISYIHAEAYPAGELKHGPLALVDETMPVVALVANDGLLAKMCISLEQVEARGGRLIIFAEEGAQLPLGDLSCVIWLPAMPAILAPILMTIPLQLLAYHVAVEKGTDVDQPRNLAKSVTVE
jgi:glucosamine--fructose-6-phosphate aminotransferase (isomerizing)